jgi:hypothetical protein
MGMNEPENWFLTILIIIGIINLIGFLYRKNNTENNKEAIMRIQNGKVEQNRKEYMEKVKKIVQDTYLNENVQHDKKLNNLEQRILVLETYISHLHKSIESKNQI